MKVSFLLLGSKASQLASQTYRHFQLDYNLISSESVHSISEQNMLFDRYILQQRQLKVVLQLRQQMLPCFTDTGVTCCCPVPPLLSRLLRIPSPINYQVSKRDNLRLPIFIRGKLETSVETKFQGTKKETDNTLSTSFLRRQGSSKTDFPPFVWP